uniref:Uncharacterized protein n=1 Tax=Panagrolaimus sp. ES5 TaxID=591445 RepID=A0AC34FKL5_9BILA
MEVNELVVVSKGFTDASEATIDAEKDEFEVDMEDEKAELEFVAEIEEFRNDEEVEVDDKVVGPGESVAATVVQFVNAKIYFPGYPTFVPSFTL